MNISEITALYDKSDYLRFLNNFPLQLEEAFEIEIPSFSEDIKKSINNITIAGMGGSAIGGEIIGSLYRDELTIPVTVARDYNLPGFVNDRSLVITSSYSGNTEETLSCFKDAVRRNANLICITTGGELSGLAVEHNAKIVTIPEGYQPRAAIGLSLIPLIRILSNNEFISDQDENIRECIEVITSLCGEYSPGNTSGNMIIELAKEISGSIPVIYTPGPPFDCLATRWRCQFTENAKILAFGNSFPELNHNEIMGWAKLTPCLDNYYVIFLRDDGESEKIRSRIEITKEIITKYGVKTAEIRSNGREKLSRMLSLLYYGDYLSFYYAIMNKTDPTPIENIRFLKHELSK
ncbi:MAG: bifunctional phosphoglucose/phosphomannose isomerase [bacterium]|nr:bifunctional phosphoglucose/phosphomannose isomerase [bacterium]